MTGFFVEAHTPEMPDDPAEFGRHMNSGCPSRLAGNPFTVVVGGFSSEVGKTTLVCELLRAFPGWEAIKVTRGHHRSRGKNPQMWRVGHPRGDEPLIYSGREENYAAGKDTARFWDAGASNVHWVIVTDGQVNEGIRHALERVRSPGILIEGNSVLRFIDADFTVMVTRSQGGKIKPTARRTLEKANAFYLSGDPDGFIERVELEARRDPRFRRCLTGVWGIPQRIKDRLAQYTSTVENPL